MVPILALPLQHTACDALLAAVLRRRGCQRRSGIARILSRERTGRLVSAPDGHAPGGIRNRQRLRIGGVPGDPDWQSRSLSQALPTDGAGMGDLEIAQRTT